MCLAWVGFSVILYDFAQIEDTSDNVWSGSLFAFACWPAGVSLEFPCQLLPGWCRHHRGPEARVHNGAKPGSCPSSFTGAHLNVQIPIWVNHFISDDFM